MKRTVQSSLINSLFITGLALLTAMSLITYKQILKLQETNFWVVHTYEVIEKANIMTLSILSLDANIDNGFTSDNLAKIAKIIESIAVDIHQVRVLTRDNLEQQNRLNVIEPLIKEKLATVQRYIKNSSLALLKMTKNQTQQIEQNITYLRSAEFKLLKLRNEEVYHKAEFTNMVVFAIVTLAYLLLITTFILLTSQNKKLVESEERQHELEFQYTKVINSSRDPIAALDTNYNVTAFNDAYKETFLVLYGKKIMLGKNLQTLLLNSPDTLGLMAAWKRALKGEEYVTIISFKPNATNEFFYEITFSAIRDKNKIVGAAQVMRDVTEKMKLDNLKTEFVSVVSHELRTPLTSIRGSLSLALSDTFCKLNDKMRQLLNIASQNCDRLIFLINDLLDIDKLEKAKMHFNLKPMDLNVIAEESVIGNKSYGEKFSVKIQLEKCPHALVVQIDPERLRQVLDNFISNAVKFTPEDGEIKVVISQHGNKARVSVVDKGEGVPPEFRQLIFQKFAQADSSTTRKRGGTGLGLSISKAIIEQHDGSIGFQSEPHVETTFYFELPLLENPASIN